MSDGGRTGGELPGGLIDELIDSAYLEASEAAWGLVRLRAAGVLEELGLWRLPRAERSLDEIAAALGVAADRGGPLAWMLDALVPTGAVSAAGTGFGTRRWTALEPPGEPARRAAAEAAGRHAAGLGSSRELIDFVAARYADFLRGERSGPTILLKSPGLELWEAYFSAANPLYDVHNAAAARGLGRELPRIGPRPRLLELGAGTGGGSAAVLAELERAGAAEGARLTLTDASPSFLLRTVERLAPAAAEIGRRRLDFNRPLEEQGIEPASVDAVIAVNALHLADDLPGTMVRLAGALAPGGVLVISESICGAGEQVHQEVVFNLLPASGTGGSRFLTARRWRELLADSPFEVEVESNRLGPELALVAVARRPAG